MYTEEEREKLRKYYNENLEEILKKRKNESREKNRKYYQDNREEILKKRKKKYREQTKKARAAKARKKYLHENAEMIKLRNRERFAKKNTEEFKAQRRAAYAEKHKDDPMTEHRMACIEAFERKRNKVRYTEKELRKKPVYEESYYNSEEAIAKERAIVVRNIKEWSDKNYKQNGIRLNDEDKEYYHREAIRYFETKEQYESTPPTNFNERNILSMRMRKIEQKFREILTANQKRNKLLND